MRCAAKIVALATFHLAFTAHAEDGGGGGGDPRRPGKAVLPEGASEGKRDLAEAASMGKIVDAQPYGKNWKDIVHVDPVPTDRTGLGEAKTHPDLKKDAMELQQQAQYLEETDREIRYGFVSIRGVRVYNYGKLAGMRLVIDMIGRGEKDKFKDDVEALAGSWTDPAKALGLTGKFQVTKNDLVEQKKRRPGEYPVPPLVLELRPVERGAR